MSIIYQNKFPVQGNLHLWNTERILLFMSNYNLDRILKYLRENIMQKGANTFHYTANQDTIHNALDLNYMETQRLLDRLVEDKYVIREEMDLGNDKGIYIGYSINPAYLDFEGYESEQIRKTNLSAIESDKIWYETENARKQFESYSSTRIMAIIACAVSVILLILEAVKLLSTQPK